jgi:large subunit ribosomal protein L6
MSRVGNKSIELPQKVSVKADAAGTVTVEGPMGSLQYTLPPGVALEAEGANLRITRASEARRTRALHGTARALVQNMVTGVAQGFVKKLEIVGVGFRAVVKGEALDLSLGYSHPVLHPIPAGIKVTVTENTKIKIEGIDKHAVGQFAADVRAYYPPEPYKGKGVRYAGEHVRRKQGKTAK